VEFAAVVGADSVMVVPETPEMVVPPGMPLPIMVWPDAKPVAELTTIELAPDTLVKVKGAPAQFEVVLLQVPLAANADVPVIPAAARAAMRILFATFGFMGF
jgi:hypothetical protein